MFFFFMLLMDFVELCYQTGGEHHLWTFNNISNMHRLHPVRLDVIDQFVRVRYGPLDCPVLNASQGSFPE